MSAEAADLLQTNLSNGWRGPRPGTWATVAGVLLGLAAVDRRVTDTLWRPNNTFVDGDSSTLVFGGLGEMGGHAVRDALAEHTTAPMSAMNYCRRGIQSDDLPRALAECYRRPPSKDTNPTQTLITNSVSLPLTLDALAQVVKHHHHVGTVPKIATIHAISSPMSVADTHYADFLRVIGKMPINSAGIGLKTVFGLIFELRNQAAAAGAKPDWFARHYQAAANILADAAGPMSPRTWHSMGRALVRLKPLEPRVLTGIITPETTIQYYYDPTDNVVKTPQALKKLQAFAAQYGAKLVVTEMPGTGHANIKAVAPYIAKTLSAT